MRIRTSHLVCCLFSIAFVLCGCPPENVPEGPAQICMGDWRLFVKGYAGDQFYMYIRIRPDGSANYLPVDYSADFPVYWERVGDMFHIQDTLPVGRSFIATVEHGCFYSGVVFENANPNEAYGEFTAEFLPSLDAPETPGPVVGP